MIVKKTRKVHTEEFKLEAINLAAKLGVATAAKSLDLMIHKSMIGAAKRSRKPVLAIVKQS